MSFYRFNDTITLYTPFEGGYERQVIPATKVQLVKSDQIEKTRATVYIPINGRRSLIFKTNRTPNSDRRTFTVEPNQIVYLGLSHEINPPSDSYTVRQVETHLSGSHHAQHVKLIAYNLPTEEDETNEGFDNPGT